MSRAPDAECADPRETMTIGCTVPTGRASRKAGRGRAMSCLVRVGCDMSGLSFWALHRRLGTAPWGRVVCMPVDRTLAEAMSTTAQCHPDKFNRK